MTIIAREPNRVTLTNPRAVVLHDLKNDLVRDRLREEAKKTAAASRIRRTRVYRRAATTD